MVPYPDITALPDDLAAALVRLVRLVNQMRMRCPDLDHVALSVETDIDWQAATILTRHIELTCRDFRLMLSPWDGRNLIAPDPDGGRRAGTD
ncbi:hypothetical protein [Niveispirillum fermenti]|uniref:hypothetical protein n=1 Tax=Niveispirillum fermenti TaxID=1233113 RepID=UPI003A85402E